MAATNAVANAFLTPRPLFHAPPGAIRDNANTVYAKDY
jgi:hypothetical protein